MTHIPEIGAENPYCVENHKPARKYSMFYSLLKMVPEKFGTKLHVIRIRNWNRFLAPIAGKCVMSIRHVQ